MEVSSLFGKYQSSDSEPEQETGNCQACREKPSRYKCPRCLFQSCSIACINKHKQDFACNGVKPETTSIKVPLAAMNIDVLRRDMAMIEKGIGISNHLKRDNIKADAKTPEELTALKKRKNLRQFLRKKRQLTFINAPSHMQRGSINKTRLQTGGKEPIVSWTIELKFIAR